MPAKMRGPDPIERLLPDAAVWDRVLADRAREYVIEALRRGTTLGGQAVGIDPSLDLLNPRIVEFIKKYTGLMANRVNRTFVEKCRVAITEIVEQGIGGYAARDHLLESLDMVLDHNGEIVTGDKAKYVCERIARTEDSRAQHAGYDEQMKRAGARERVWMANPGACEFCAALNGKVVGIDQPFFPVGSTFQVDREDGSQASMSLDYADVEYPPLHPSCVCTVGYRGI